MPEYRAINKNLVDTRTVQIIERVWLKCKCPKFRCDDAIQKAKRKHGTTKGERGSYMLKNDSGKYTTHKYGSIHATRIRGHWDWRGINKELALGCVWMFAIGRRNFGSRSCREGGAAIEIDRLPILYVFISHPFLNALLLLFVPWHVSLWSPVAFTRWNQTISVRLRNSCWIFLKSPIL